MLFLKKSGRLSDRAPLQAVDPQLFFWGIFLLFWSSPLQQIQLRLLRYRAAHRKYDLVLRVIYRKMLPDPEMIDQTVFLIRIHQFIVCLFPDQIAELILRQIITSDPGPFYIKEVPLTVQRNLSACMIKRAHQKFRKLRILQISALHGLQVVDL